MSRRVVILRHGDDPPDDRVHSYLHANGFTPDTRRPFRGEPIGPMGEDVVGTVIHGGPYNAFDTDLHPFLREEYAWIEASLAAGIPMLGLCQGAQMIAHHMGAEVGPRPDETHEFGYYAVSPTPEGRDFLPEPLHMTQAHFHTFAIPEGAVHLASSAAFTNQAFRSGSKVYGLQFHPEVTIEGFRRWQNAFQNQYEKTGAQTRAEQDRLMHAHDAAQAAWFHGFLSRLFTAHAPGQGDAG